MRCGDPDCDGFCYPPCPEPVTCEAAAQAFAVFEDPDVPPCDEPSSVLRDGYRLCQGCDEALTLLVGLGSSAAKVMGELVMRQLQGESEADQRARLYTIRPVDWPDVTE